MMNETMDQAKAEEFAGRMITLLNDAFLGMLISIGHQTRLFDIMAEMPAASSDTIAQAAGLQERYVREWLAGVVVARIVSYDHSRFVGVDFSAEGIETARAEAASWKLPNAHFEVADITAGLPGEFDLVTAFDVIHDLAKPKVVLSNIFRALRPKGVFLMMDIAASSRLEENLNHPFGPALYGVSVMHCMTVSLAQSGEGLGTMWGEQMAQEYLKEAGFSSVQVHHLEGDPMHAIYVAHC